MAFVAARIAAVAARIWSTAPRGGLGLRLRLQLGLFGLVFFGPLGLRLRLLLQLGLLVTCCRRSGVSMLTGGTSGVRLRQGGEGQRCSELNASASDVVGKSPEPVAVAAFEPSSLHEVYFGFFHFDQPGCGCDSADLISSCGLDFCGWSLEN